VGGIASQEAFGYLTILVFNIIRPDGIESAEYIGAAGGTSYSIFHVIGIPSAEHFGRTRARQVWYGKHHIHGSKLGSEFIPGRPEKGDVFPGKNSENATLDGTI